MRAPWAPLLLVVLASCQEDPVPMRHAGGWATDDTWTELEVGEATAITALRAAGDVDGDGVDDLVALASDGEEERLLWFLGGVPVATTPALVVPLDDAPYTLLTPGDLDADGFADVVACTGVPGFTMNVYRGGPGGPGGEVGWTVHAPEWARGETEAFISLGDVDGSGLPHLLAAKVEDLVVFEGAETEPEPRVGRYFLWNEHDVADPGDVNGDGYGDLLAWEGSLKLFWGNPRGLEYHLFDEVEVAGDYPGVRWLWPVGDVNSDGLPDTVLVGDHGTDDHVYLAFGDAEGLNAAVWLEGGWGEDLTPPRVARAGDLDGDGVGDVLVVVPHADRGQGGVAAFAGGEGGPSDVPAAWLAGEVEGTRLGDALASDLDLDADGFPDVVASALDPADGTAHLRLYASPWRP